MAEVLKSRLPRVFNAKQDQIKWLISDYASKRYQEVLGEMIFSMMEIAFKHGLSVVKEGMWGSSELLKQLAAKQNVPLFFVNISAPIAVLQSRFQERVHNQKQGAKIANIDPVRFEKIRRVYEETKIDTPLEFDSSVQSPEEIADEIISYIHSTSQST